MLGEVLTGRRAASQSDRVLATVMFTDIADSTSTAAWLGDGEWRSHLDEHNRRARRVIEDHRGVFVNTTGDGVIARFDGPARSVSIVRDLTAGSGLVFEDAGEYELKGLSARWRLYRAVA